MAKVYRDAAGTHAMTTALLTDFRQAARSLARAPGFTAVAVLTLGVALGMATAIYAALKQVVLDPLPYADAGRLMVLQSEVPGSGTDEAWGASTAQYFYFGEHAQAVEAIGAMQSGADIRVVNPDGRGIRTAAVQATSGIPPLFDARPVVGRLLATQDDAPGAPLVVLISDGLWRTHFGADPDIVGKPAQLEMGANRIAADIVGVVSTAGATAFDQADLWLPLQLNPAGPHYNQHTYMVIAKRKARVSLAAAQTEIDGLTGELAEAFPQVYGTFNIDGEAFGFMERFGFRSRWHSLKDYVAGAATAPLWIAQAAIALLLVIAWVAVANLVLARIETQRPELAVRSALGASRAAVLRQLAATCLLIVGGAWLVGTVLGWWLCTAFVAADPVDLPRAEQIGLDGGTLLVTASAAVLVAASLALAGAWRLRGLPAEIADAGRGATAGRARLRARSVLVAAQVAVAFVLLIGAGLLVTSFRNLTAVHPGIDPAGTVTMRLAPGSIPADDWWPLLRELQAEAAALPGALSVGAAQRLPLTADTPGCTAVWFEDQAVGARLNEAKLSLCSSQDFVTPGYFAAVGIPVLSGRAFSVQGFDDPAERGAVVSRAFVAKFFPDEEPIGKRISAYGWPWFSIVGVVGDTYPTSVAAEPTPQVYYPLTGIPSEAGWDALPMALAVRTALSEPAALLPTLRRVVADLHPDIVIEDVAPLSAVVERSMRQDRFMAALVGFAAVSALLFAVVGLYGVVAYVVARRGNEIGMRMAVGALPAQVRRMMVFASLKTVAAGLAIGVAASLGLGGVMRGLLFGVAPTSPAVYAASILVLTSAAALASWFAAGRAARITPMDALRTE